MLDVFFGFEGRIGRRNYVLSIILQSIMVAAAYVLLDRVTLAAAILTEMSMRERVIHYATAAPHAIILLIMSCWMLLSASTQRARDFGHGGLYFVGTTMGILLPVVNAIVAVGLLFYYALFPGTQGPNANGSIRRTLSGKGHVMGRQKQKSVGSSHGAILQDIRNRGFSACEKTQLAEPFK